jgi:hypothetical protein
LSPSPHQVPHSYRTAIDDNGLYLTLRIVVVLIAAAGAPQGRGTDPKNFSLSWVDLCGPDGQPLFSQANPLASDAGAPPDNCTRPHHHAGRKNQEAPVDMKEKE